MLEADRSSYPSLHVLFVAVVPLLVELDQRYLLSTKQSTLCGVHLFLSLPDLFFDLLSLKLVLALVETNIALLDGLVGERWVADSSSEPF